MKIASTLVNEKIKLAAVFANSIAVTLFFAGVIAPLARIWFGESGSNADAAYIILWAVASIVTHTIAQSLLSDLEVEP